MNDFFTQRYTDVTLGLMTEEEQRILEVISLPNRKDRFNSDELKNGVTEEYKQKIGNDHESEQNVYYVPLLWAADLVNKAFDEGRIKYIFDRKTLLDVSNTHSSRSRD